MAEMVNYKKLQWGGPIFGGVPNFGDLIKILLITQNFLPLKWLNPPRTPDAATQILKPGRTSPACSPKQLWN